MYIPTNRGVFVYRLVDVYYTRCVKCAKLATEARASYWGEKRGRGEVAKTRGGVIHYT